MPDNVWIADDPGFKRAALELWEAFDRMGRKLLESIAEYLGLERHWFDDKVGEGNSVLRVIHYPPLKEGATGVRAGAHEDINVITLLLGAEEGGLELLDRNGRWLPVNPPPGTLVCNVGDMLQRLTNHVLPSTTHRVVNPTGERAQASALLDAVLPALQFGLPDRDAAGLHHAGAARTAIRSRSSPTITCASACARSSSSTKLHQLAKLYFYYSTMNAGKSTSLLQSSHNYRERGMRTLVYTAEFDQRGGGKVHSRIGLSSEALHFAPGSDLFGEIDAENRGQRCQLRPTRRGAVPDARSGRTAREWSWTTSRFPCSAMASGPISAASCFAGSARLLALADELTELKTICHCGRKATMVVRVGADGLRRARRRAGRDRRQRALRLALQAALLRSERAEASVLTMAAARRSPVLILLLLCVPACVRAGSRPAARRIGDCRIQSR